MIIIDAQDAIVGRLAAFAAKKALTGEEIVVVNAEKAVISGKSKNTFEKYGNRRLMQQKADPHKSASQSWSKRPDKLFKRIISGMLPKHSVRAKQALQKIMIHLSVPKEFEGKSKKFEATSKDLLCDYTTLGELCDHLGWKAE